MSSADWRASVSQADRNIEVSKIANVLASLEPGATTQSKVALATKFELTIFQAATTLEDYHKKISKRLNKVKKSYVPTEQTTSKESVLQELRRTYGDSIKYILQHGPKALTEMERKYGNEKAETFRLHLDGVKSWSRDLQTDGKLSDEHIDKLQGLLEKRLETIRGHVVKLADPRLFTLESLQKIELKGRAARIVAADSKKRFHEMQRSDSIDIPTFWKTAQERMQRAVPLPTRSQQNDERAALIHLDKMRAAADSMTSYALLADQGTVSSKALVQAHEIATSGMTFVRSVVHAHRQRNKVDSVTLEDAWVKQIHLPTNGPPDTDMDSSSPTKRPRTARHPVLRSRVLLTPGRKTPVNLLPAFRRKRATLVRPPPTGAGSHLILEFGSAFTMTIHMVPLLVSLRAYNQMDEVDSSPHRATMKPLNHGLLQRGNLSVWAVNGSYEEIGCVVEERLRDASAHATHVLRQCFASAVKENAPDFETEILEATALLEFLQAVRTSYMPDWKDVEDEAGD